MIAGHGHASLRPQATGATQKPRRTPAGDDGSRRMECTGRTAVEDVSHVAAIVTFFS